MCYVVSLLIVYLSEIAKQNRDNFMPWVRTSIPSFRPVLGKGSFNIRIIPYSNSVLVTVMTPACVTKKQ